MRYEFNLILGGEGETPEQAWQDAIESFTLDPGDAPEPQTNEASQTSHAVDCAYRLKGECTCNKDAGWTQDVNWPRSEWQQDVANGDTQLGYAAWVEHNKESATQSDINIRIYP